MFAETDVNTDIHILFEFPAIAESEVWQKLIEMYICNTRKY